MRQTIEDAYTPEELRKLQLLELSIYKDFVRICKKYDIAYYAFYGTLLGAVRHKGIIPWDDDIDVFVLPEGYEKLQQVLPQELGERYEFINAENNPQYPFLTSRIMLRGTEFRTWSMRKLKCESGIFLDIFCAHYVLEEKKLRDKQFRYCWIYEKMFILHHFSEPNLPYKGLKRVAVFAMCAVGHLVLKLFPRKFLLNKANKWAYMYDRQKTGLLANVFSLSAKKTIFPYTDIFPLKEVPFEDTTMMIPANANKILAHYFGEDYMTPLPEGKRSYVIPYKLDFGEY